MRRAALLLVLTACRPQAETISPGEVFAAHTAQLQVLPDDSVWAHVPVHPAPLILQDLVEPRKMQPGISEVRVQALTDGRAIAFRLRWSDATRDDVRAPARFSDACAVQLPAATQADLPAPQMGESGRAVELTYWSAAAQAQVDGRPDDITALYPNAKIDHYPFNAPALAKDPKAQAELARAYAPARAAGNPTLDTASAVQDLVALGPGTIAPAPKAVSTGAGVRGKDGWAVVVQRPLPEGLAPGGASQVAFAVWNGSESDAGARKMRTGWIPLRLEGAR